MQEDSSLLFILYVIIGGFLGLTGASVAGNFGYRSADRLPGESRRPHCVFCMRPMRWIDFLPLLGWITRMDPHKLPCPCGKRTGLWPQPVTEITGFILGALAIFLAGWSWSMVPLCIGLGILPAIALIDMAFGLIPDELNLALAVLGFATLIIEDGDIFMGLISSAGLLSLGLVLALGYSKWRGREMLGLGDVKFFAAAGLWLPLDMIPWFLATSGIIGAIIGTLWKRGGGGKEFPFAPALCLSLAGCVFYQLYTTPW